MQTDPQNKLYNLEIVLVNPTEPGNIGSVCRAMKNMGVSHLTIVSDRSYDVERIRTLALHAFDVYERARFSSSLEEVLRDSVVTAGVTRRRGKFRKYLSLTPEQLAEKIQGIKSGQVSVVFGNEGHGLTDKELALCNLAVHIPSSPDFPSLNLSHAVQIITYSLYNQARKNPYFIPVSQKEMERVTGVINSSLKDIGFFTLRGEEETHKFLRDIFTRGFLDKTEALRLEKIFKKIKDLKLHKR